MLNFVGLKKSPRFVDNGRVACPRRAGDVDIEVCALCSSLHAIDREDGLEIVRCGLDGLRRLPEYPPR